MSINRVLIVGHGSIGKRHLRLARELLPAADIRVLRHQACEETPEYANGCFSAEEDALAFAPHIAVVANPAPFHLGIAQLLADVGVHLLIEKPLSSSTKGVEELISTCKRNEIVLMTGYNLRFLPSLQQFRKLIQEKYIGNILSVRCEIGQYLPSWRPDSDYRLGVSARSELGGGALLELSHEIDYLRWIFGEIDWVNATLLKQSNLEIDVEDTAHLILGFKSDVNRHQLVASVTMDFIRHDTTRICTAIGSKGSLRWNGLSGLIELFDSEVGSWSEVFHFQHSRDDSYIAEWLNFLNSIDGRQTPRISGEDGLRVMEAIDAIREASALAHVVKLVRSRQGEVECI